MRMKHNGAAASEIGASTSVVDGFAEAVFYATEVTAPKSKIDYGAMTSLIKRGITPKYVEDNGICVLNQKCIRDQKVSFEQARETSNEKKIAKEKLLQDFDVLVNSTGVGTLGRVAQVRRLDKKTTVDSHVTIENRPYPLHPR